MIKLIAMTSVIISGSMFGATLCKSECDSLKETEELYCFISHIQREIEKKSNTLDKIFFDFFSTAKNSLLEKKLKEFRGNHREKMLFLCSEICSQEAKSELFDFASTLGTLDRKAQTEALKKARASMEKELIKKRGEYLSKSRLYKTLSLLVSCVIAVLLY